MKFNIENYEGKYAMHCKTYEEAKSFCNYLHSMNRQWGSGTSYADFTYWEKYEKDTCYSFNTGTYGSYKHFQVQYNYTILEWSDFMNKVFTKADLKSGDIITFREGSYGMYIDTFDSVMFLEDGGSYLPLTDIIDITFKDKYSYGESEWDIVKIRRPKKANDIIPRYWLEGEVIWEEKPPIEEMTLEEVCKALGKEIKIVKSK